MPHVLLAKPIHPAATVRLLSEPGYTVESLDYADRAEFLARLADADAVVLSFTAFDRAAVDAAPRLRIVARHGVGYDSVDVAALDARGITLALAGSANAVSVAEHTLALLLALARRVVRVDADVRAGRWQASVKPHLVELYGKRALVIGGGRIGRRVARLFAAFEMQVEVFDPYLPADTVWPEGVRRVDDRARALAAADVVTVHVPLNDETRGLLDPHAMKPGAILLNTARGGIIDEAQLLAALADGHLGGAGLDVLVTEPAAADHPLFAHQNLLVTPHCAASTDEGLRRMGLVCAENIIECLAGRLGVENVVNPQTLRR